MATYQVNVDGTCPQCKTVENPTETLICFDCKLKFHVICSDRTPFCNRSFVKPLKAVKSKNFQFICDICVTKKGEWFGKYDR